MTGIFLAEGRTREETVAVIKAGCEWDFDIAEELFVESIPSRDELIRLRLFDPRCDFLTKQD